MYQSLETLFQSAGTPRYDENDPTLSGGERAFAALITTLLEHWDRLDGHQQRALVEVLEESTRASEEAAVHLQRLTGRH